jgi:hypothetical protein
MKSFWVACAMLLVCAAGAVAETIMDHDVVLDASGKLMPWTPYERIVQGSMNYIKQCPTEKSKHGDDPWFLITSKLKDNGAFMRNQNNQGSNVYYAVETLRRYYAYSGDAAAFEPVRKLLDRVLAYHTPGDWDWANVPRTQDDTPDGEYTDATSEPDKMCLVGVGYLRFARLTGESKYVEPAKGIARTILAHLGKGDETHSPLPFRVDLKTGKVLDDFTADMVFCALFFEELAALGDADHDQYLTARNALWDWVMAYPVKNHHWSGYYEDVKSDHDNLNQQVALESARYMLERFDDRPEYATEIPAIVDWVCDRFGKTKQFGATSIREQDTCFKEMSSHTSRYASVVAGWWALCEDRGLLDAPVRAALYEEARAAFALCTYSTWSKYSKGDCALNYVGVGYIAPWFSDSYFDFLPHILDGMAAMPAMNAKGECHILHSSDMVRHVEYREHVVTYGAASDKGEEWLLVPFEPRVESNGAPLAKSAWTYGPHRGAAGMLHIRRDGQKSIVVTMDAK